MLRLCLIRAGAAWHVPAVLLWDWQSECLNACYEVVAAHMRLSGNKLPAMKASLADRAGTAAARVKVLEDKLPALSAKLPAHYQKAIDADGLKNSSPTEQNLQERLAHLENAMAILLRAQVRALLW